MICHKIIGLYKKKVFQNFFFCKRVEKETLRLKNMMAHDCLTRLFEWINKVIKLNVTPLFEARD